MPIEIQADEELIQLEPLIDPEHKALIDKAAELLRRQDEHLLSRLSNTGDSQCAVQFALSERERGRIISDFHSDPFRARIINEISRMKLMFEKPRYAIRKIRPDANTGQRRVKNV